MNNIRNQYSYSILRYYHDNATGEFVNVGVAIYSNEQNYFNVRLKTSTVRISETFPDINHSAFRILMKTIQKRFDELIKKYSFTLDFGHTETKLDQVLKTITPIDDSALKWSIVSNGISSNFSNTLDNLYTRYVSKYEHKKTISRRSDTDVWRTFKKDLSDRSILDYFNEKTIESKSDEVKFPLAWKNGIWHCVEPLSFDLSAADSIKDKAHKCLGEITSITNDNSEAFKLYLLLSRPSESKLNEAFDRALAILEKIPGDKEIYLEDDKLSLINKLSQEIQAHEALLSRT